MKELREFLVMEVERERERGKSILYQMIPGHPYQNPINEIYIYIYILTNTCLSSVSGVIIFY